MRAGMTCAAGMLGVMTLMGSVAFAQERPSGQVTAVHGGVARLRLPPGAIDEEDREAIFLSLSPDPRRGYDPELSRLYAGDALETASDGEVVFVLSGQGVVVHLAPDSRLEIGAELGGEEETTDVPLSFRLTAGKAFFVHGDGANKWLLVQAVAENSQGYVLFQEGSLAVVVGPEAVDFIMAAGRGRYFDGELPAGLIIGDDRMPTVREQAVLDAAGDNAVASNAPRRTGRDTDRSTAAWAGLRHAVFGSALARGEDWIRQAERGDLTPTRAATRAPVDTFGGSLAVPPAFDQARPAAVVSAPGVQPTRVTAPAVVQQTLADRLIQSGNAASVAVGVRLTRSRIIGSPGTTTLIRTNPQVRPLVRLTRPPSR